MRFLNNILAKAGLIVDGTTQLNTIANATTDTDRFIVSDSGVIKYRTGAELASDIDAMTKAVYDTDNDGVVDKAEKITIIARNSTGSPIYKGTIVYLSGSTGNRPNMLKAQANSEATSSKTFGVVVADVADNSDGEVAAIGTLEDLDTRSNATNPFTSDTLVDGDLVWLSPTTAGYITRTKPLSPNHSVFIGYVARTSPTNGRIVYKIQNGLELDELHNVSASTPSNNDGIFYNSTTGLWEAKQISAIGGVSGSGTTNYVTKFTSSSAIGNSTLQTDANGNFGINVTPNSNWGSSYDVLQINNSSSFFGSGNQTILADNIYIDASNNYRYLTTAGASYYRQTFGQHYWYSISSGTAGNIINTPSLMFFSNSGSLGIGTVGPTAKLDVNGDVKIATIANATTDTDRFIVSDGGVIKYRTGSEVLSDIGGAAASSISGTTNYIPKFTSSSAIGNSQIFDNGTAVGIGTITPTAKLDIDVTGSGNIFHIGYGANFDNYYTSGSSGVHIFRNASSERMRLDASGNLGIGTSSPTYKLNVLASAGTQAIFQAGQTGVSNGYTINSNGTNLTYQWYNGGNEAMRLDASGNLGLGTTTFPTFSNTTQLVVRGGTGPSIIQSVSNDKGSSITLYSGNNSSDNPVVIYQKDLRFASVTDDGLTGYAERMRLDASGNLGLGTSAPSVPLEVNGEIRTTRSGVASQYLQLEGGNATGPFITATGVAKVLTIRNNSTTSSDINFDQAVATGYYFKQAGTTKLTLDASGNLGLGVTPAATSNSYVNYQNGNTVIMGNSSDPTGYYTANATFNLGWKYIVSGYSSKYEQFFGGHAWFTAASGTAGNAISFTQAMTLDADGDLGIGTTNPAEKLHVNGINVGIRIDGTTASRLYFNRSGNYIWSTGLRAGDTKYYIYDERAVSRLVIDDNGNVGIGTTSPTYKLVVSNNGALGFEVDPTSSSGGIVSLLTYDRSVGSYKPLQINSEDIRFQTGTASTERMRITSGGNVGIGTSSPITKLHTFGKIRSSNTSTSGAGDASGIIELGDNASGIFRGFENDITTAGNFTHIGGFAGIIFTASNAVLGSQLERMRITSGGNVLVGTTTDVGVKLNINGSVLASNNGGNVFSINSAGANYGFILNNSANTFSLGYGSSLSTVGTSVLTWNSSGNVGIGTTSPAYKLDVNGNFRSLVNNEALILQSVDANGNYLTLHNGSSAYAYLGSNYHLISGGSASDLGIRGQNNIVFLSGGGIERMRITSGGDVGIGTTSPARKLEVLSSGAIPARVSTTNSNMAIEYISTAGTRYNWLAGAQYNVSGAFEITPSTAVGGTTFSTPAFVVTSGGDVGIGTTTPGTKLEVNGAIKTAAPSGGTAKPFKIGAAATVTPTSQNRTIEIEIDGTTYYLTAKTTND